MSQPPPPPETPPEHLVVTPSILYFGTPVVLVTSLNADGTTNISPMSSAWALADRVVLGLGAAGQAVHNLRRHGECVLNLPCARLWAQVERIARTTGRHPVPAEKAAAGFRYVEDKFALGGFTPMSSDLVRPARISDCPLQLEARVLALHEAQAGSSSGPAVTHLIVETQVVRVHAHREIVLEGTNHIDARRWQPLLYVFRHYFAAGADIGRNFRAET